jgi:hypothetical protein
MSAVKIVRKVGGLEAHNKITLINEMAYRGGNGWADRDGRLFTTSIDNCMVWEITAWFGEQVNRRCHHSSLPIYLKSRKTTRSDCGFPHGVSQWYHYIKPDG